MTTVLVVDDEPLAGLAEAPVYTAQLRRELEVGPSRPRHLITEPGMSCRPEL